MHYDQQSTGQGSEHDSAMPVQDDPNGAFSQVYAPSEPPTLSYTEAFLEFHKANPHVYLALRDLAVDWLDEGKRKCSITLLYNVCRWRMSLRTEGAGMFELNDHHQAFYARALMRFEPRLAGMFDIRRSPEADAWIATFGSAAA